MASDRFNGTQQTLNDPNYSSYPNGLWRIETVWGISCSPTLRQNNGTMATVVKSKSNITNNRQVGIKNNNAGNLVVYPNPTAGSLTVQLSAGQEHSVVKLVSLLGEELLSFETNNQSLNIDMTTVRPGTYLLQVTTNNKTYLQRVVKQ